MSIAIATITSEGKAMDASIGLVSLEVRKALDRIPRARVVVLDGSASQRAFPVSNTAFFEPGKRVRIDMRYEGGKDVQVFEGLVVRHAVEAGSDGSELDVELEDAAIALTRQRKSLVHRDQLDSDVMEKLIRGASLKVGKVDATKVQHKELVQYYVSDWDFLLSRADVNGQVVIVSDGEVSVRSMDTATSGKGKARYELGIDDIVELELELDGSGQWASMTSQAWDPASQAFAQPVAARPITLGAGNIDPRALAPKLGGDDYTLMLPATLLAAELAPWASARLARSRLSFLRGRMVVTGRADLLPFDCIEIAGVGDRFNGNVLVAGVVQRLDSDGWRTELELGLSPDWFARTPDIADVPAGGLLPPVTGLQVGLVDAFESDPDSELRIRIKLPGLFGEDGAVWARMARPDAGKDRGFVFWPELGDEVVVGFLAGDPRQAVVLGALYGSVNTPPQAVAPPSQDNNQRAIVSKAGTTVLFDDEKASVTVITAKKNKIVLDDGGEAINLADQHGNTITMDKNGITLTSAAKLTIDASGEVVIKGKTVDVQ